MNATAEIITIGDEILYGHIVDTNSQWIAATLSDTGIKVVRSTTVGDVVESIMNALKEASRRADIILITGGLGPTRDDLTKECLARFFNCDMQLHEEALAEVSNFFERRGRELTKLNRQQAVLPVCCTKITNRVGTAPGMWFDHEGKVFVSMPGVPGEMKLMMQESIVPRLRDRFKLPAIHHLTIKTVGIGESFLADKISEWEDALPPHIRLAYLPGYGEVKLRLTAIGDRAALADEMHAQADRLRDYAGPYIYGRDDDTLEGVVGQLLKHKNYTVGCAESCTGGYLSHRFTRVPGSSEYFKGSIIAYANEVKESELGVPKEILETHGAVSEEVARAMAEGIRRRLKTDIGIATTGVAGPGGGSPEKPVGTVWIACANESQTIARKLQLASDRLTNIRLSTTFSLNLVRRFLLGTSDDR